MAAAASPLQGCIDQVKAGAAGVNSWRYGVASAVSLTIFVVAIIAIVGSTSMDMTTGSAILLGCGGFGAVWWIYQDKKSAEEAGVEHSWKLTIFKMMIICVPALFAGILGVSGALTTMKQLGWIPIGTMLAIIGLSSCCIVPCVGLKKGLDLADQYNPQALTNSIRHDPTLDQFHRDHPGLLPAAGAEVEDYSHLGPFLMELFKGDSAINAFIESNESLIPRNPNLAQIIELYDTNANFRQRVDALGGRHPSINEMFVLFKNYIAHRATIDGALAKAGRPPLLQLMGLAPAAGAAPAAGPVAGGGARRAPRVAPPAEGHPRSSAAAGGARAERRA